MDHVRDAVQDYYGNQLQSSDDLKTDACATSADMPGYIKSALSSIHDEVLTRYYGCGLIAPEALNGLSVLDLGSGAGRDVYVLSKLVGEQGRVVGVDMTDQQLAVANAHKDYHRKKYGYGESNVAFHKGYLETLDDLPLEDGSFDLIVSNCVINLCTDKPKVLRDAFRLLKPGGEIYFSDVYADARVPEALLNDPVLHGECLSGALFWEDFNTLALDAGCAIPRIVTARELAINNEEIATKLAGLTFASVTYRLFKAPADGDAASATYQGSIENHEDGFTFDRGHVFTKGMAMNVDGPTATLLRTSRLSNHFDFSAPQGCGAKKTEVVNPFLALDGAPASSSCC